MKNKLIQKLQILLRQQNAIEHKESIYLQYGVTSSKDMKIDDLIHLINKLEGNTQRPRPQAQANDYIKAFRSEVLKLLTAPAEGEVRKRGLGIPNDWSVLNPFILHHGCKTLREMTIPELTAFKSKLYAMRKSGWHYQQQDKNKPSPESTIARPIYLPAVSSVPS